MASATMQTHQANQAAGRQVAESNHHHLIELGASCAPSPVYLQQPHHHSHLNYHHHHHQNQQFHQHPHQLQHLQELSSNQNTYVASSAQFYSTDHSAARAVVSAAMSAHLERPVQSDQANHESSDQFYYQQQQPQQGSQELAYQHLYAGGGEQQSYVSPTSGASYALNQQHTYEAANNANQVDQLYANSHHSYPPFIQSFSRASADSTYQNYSSYLAANEQQSSELANQPANHHNDTNYRHQLSFGANQGRHRSIDGNDRSR